MIDTRELAKIDLNLLISLQVLIDECNVSRAAERLFITQPAMSKTLSRLRRLFDDPLFTRRGHGMAPTPRALQLVAPLAEILANITQLVSASEFDPASYRGEVNMAMSEYIAVAVLPPLISRLSKGAPGLSIRTITRVENQLEQLRSGNLDFAFHIEQSQYGEEFRTQTLGGSPPAILVRQSHPLTQGTVTWERLSEFPVIRLYISDLEQLEIMRTTDAFDRVRQPGQRYLETSHLLTALEVLHSTDYFMPGPAYILQNRSGMDQIVALPVPESDVYTMNYVLAAHQRTANSALHNWLWQEILTVVQGMRPDAPHKVRQRIAASGE